METYPEGAFGINSEELEVAALSHEDLMPYDEQALPSSTAEPDAPSLANRIGTTKVYLISEAVSGVTRAGKRKHDDDEDVETTVEEDMVEDVDPTVRDNAILFQGSPISHLPTSNIFAYATHFDSHPIALEWIDDTTCILVFSSRVTARSAHRHLSKSPTEEPSEDGYVTAKPIPIALWPPEERINKSLGMGEGVKGVIQMRWATNLDVKRRGAKQRSQFYKKHGQAAGKEGHNVENSFEAGREQKRRRHDGGQDGEALEKAQLDQELDTFLAEDDTTPPAVTSEPLLARIGNKSKMRSDYLEMEGKSLLERTSDLRLHPVGQSRRGQGMKEGGEYDDQDDRGGLVRRGQRRERRGGGRNPRPKVTQEDLDAELDAFLKSKD